MEISIKGMNYTIGGNDKIASKDDRPVLFVKRGGKTVKLGSFYSKEDMLTFFDIMNEMGMVVTDEVTKTKLAANNTI